MGRLRGRVLGCASMLLIALSACSSSSPQVAPTGATGAPSVDMQVRPVVEFVSPDSSEEPPAPTCDGQDESVADCVAANHDADQLILVGPEPTGGTYVLGPVIVDASDVQSAGTIPLPTEPDQGWAVTLQLTPAGTSAFADATATLAGEQIAIVIDGEVVSVPTVEVPITSGAVQIQGSFDETEATAVASHLIPPTDASP